MSDNELELMEEDSEEIGFWDTKKEQASNVVESLGELLGGDEKTGLVALAVGAALFIGSKIKGAWNKRKQKEKERLFQEAIKKQDAEIRDLKKDAADSHAKQKHYEEVLEAYSASRGDDYEA